MVAMLRREWLMALVLGGLGCSDDGVIAQDGDGSASPSEGSTGPAPTTAAETTAGSASTTTSTGPVDGTASSAGDDTPKLDVGSMTSDDTGPLELCEVPDGGMDAPGPCDYQAPAGSFDPVLEWEWEGDGAIAHSATTPLVANLTDDNGDGSIDLCDVPDVVVLAWAQPFNEGPGYLYVLDGASGSVHFQIETGLDDMNPALGDIDGDGLPELVAQAFGGGAVAFEHDGTLKWQSPARTWPRFNALSLADLDADGDVEILMPGGQVLDHDGNVVLASYLPSPTQFWEGGTPIAVDLDGDDDLEIIDGRRAFHHDGTPIWNQATSACPQPPDGADIMPAVADLDDDGAPEVFLSGAPYNDSAMFCVLDGDGSILLSQADLPAAPGAVDWLRPPAIHDIDGDGSVEVGVGGSTQYFAVMRMAAGSLTPLFVATGLDDTGSSGATAFDFLGDGTAEAIYMDQSQLFAYDSDGNIELMVDRQSFTQIEYPVVADVDNDGSAEIVVTSNSGEGGSGEAPVRVFHDDGDRWVPARRIWNQHVYHVTNVREDGTIPMVQPPFWQQLNTFRTQAQIATTGGTCEPAG